MTSRPTYVRLLEQEVERFDVIQVECRHLHDMNLSRLNHQLPHRNAARQDRPMKSVSYHSYGDRDVLSLEEAADPGKPHAGDARVRVHATSITPSTERSAVAS